MTHNKPLYCKEHKVHAFLWIRFFSHSVLVFGKILRILDDICSPVCEEESYDSQLYPWESLKLEFFSKNFPKIIKQSKWNPSSWYLVIRFGIADLLPATSLKISHSEFPTPWDITIWGLSISESYNFMLILANKSSEKTML